MQFASIDHHDVPWRAGQKVETYPAVASDYTMVTRENFQHNEPNPILVSFRANDMNPQASDWAKWLERPALGAWHHADSAHIDHARRVLTRLAALA